MYVESTKPLKLPCFCMACGKDTAHAVWLNSDGHKRNTAMGCLFLLTPYGHIWEVIRMLRQKRARVPICWRCHMRAILPDPSLAKRIWIFAGLLIGMWVLFETGNPGFGLLSLVAAIAVLIPLIKENQAHVRDYLPIELSYSNEHYRYAVYSGPFKDFLISEGIDHKLVVGKSRPAAADDMGMENEPYYSSEPQAPPEG